MEYADPGYGENIKDDKVETVAEPEKPPRKHKWRNRALLALGLTAGALALGSALAPEIAKQYSGYTYNVVPFPPK
jgi:hypothetical protein